VKTLIRINEEVIVVN